MVQARDHRQFIEVAFVGWAEDINSAAKCFCLEQSLICETLYHDLPLWIIHEPRQSIGRLRRIQVLGYRVEHRPYISFVAAVNTILSNDIMLIPKQSSARCCPMETFVVDGKFNRQKFLVQLTDTWKQSGVLQLDPNDTMKVSMSRPK